MAIPQKREGRGPGAGWIDATRPASGRRLWGMNLVERQIRELARLGIQRISVWVSDSSEEAVRRMRSDLPRLYPVELRFRRAEGRREVIQSLEKAEESLLLLEGDGVYDERVLSFLAQGEAGRAVCAEEGGASAAHLSVEQARRLAEAAQKRNAETVEAFLEEAGIEIHRPSELSHYVPSLRLTLPPFALRVPPQGDLRPIDHLMYRRSFKGVIDAIARYGYYHLVRWITRRLSETALSPNLFTVLSILCIWGAAPCFATGRFGLGVLIAWFGVILDSVDGKLARLRLHLSETMGAVEHIAAMPGLGAWYLATGYYLSDGDLFSGGEIPLKTWILIAAFLADKIATGSFKALYGKELFDYGRIDEFFHLIAARRNVSLLFFTMGAVWGRLDVAFSAVVAWTVITLGFHLFRFAWIAISRSVEEAGS